MGSAATDLYIPSPDKVPWIRTSERLTFNQCEMKWHWTYNDRLRGRTPSPALRFGSLVHLALEAFYRPGIKRGPKPATTFEKLYEQELKEQYAIGFRDEDGTWHEAGELGVVMLQEYYKHYGRDERWKVLACEHKFHWPVMNRRGRVIFVYVGVLDLVVLDRLINFYGVVDHKTTKDDPTKKADALVLDEQTGAYWTYGVDSLRHKKMLGPRAKLDGMIFNFLRKGKPDTRKVNAEGQSLNLDGTVSKKQPTPLFHRELVYRDKHDGDMVRARVRSQARKMRMMRAGELLPDKKPGTLHNPHCKWCEFRDMCELHETGGDWESFRDMMFDNNYDPYEQHEIYAGETA